MLHQATQDDRRQQILRTYLQEVPSLPRKKHYAANLIRLWIEQDFPTIDCAKAYVLVKYAEPSKDLMDAVIKFQYMANDPFQRPYLSVPEFLRNRAQHRLRVALQAMNVPNWLDLLPITDKRYEEIRMFHEDTIIFERDPENSINLRAFATDNENVHRSSVQTMITESVQSLPAATANFPLNAHLLFSIIDAADSFPWSSDSEKMDTIMELAIDIGSLQIQTMEKNVFYSSALDHIWITINAHPCKVALIERLFEELIDGVGKCPNGKLARLFNVLQGFDNSNSNSNNSNSNSNSPATATAIRQAFQNKFATLRHLSNRKDQYKAALDIFEEYQIPVDEQVAWLDALEDE